MARLERLGRAGFCHTLPLWALLLTHCGNTDSAPGLDPTLDFDAESDPVQAGDGGMVWPPINPSPIPVGSGKPDKSDAGTEPGSGPTPGDAGSARDARADELGAFSSVERLLVSDGKTARVHALDVPSRAYLDSINVNGAGAIYAGASGRYGYVLERESNQVQVISMGLPELAGSAPVLTAPSLLTVAFSGLGPSAFAASGAVNTILFAGTSELVQFDERMISLGAATKTRALGAPVNGGVLAQLGDTIVVSERADALIDPRLGVYGGALSPRNSPTLDCPVPQGAAVAQQTLVVGCSDGIVRWDASQADVDRLDYPDTASGQRARKLVASPSEIAFLTLLGDQLCIVRDKLSCVRAPVDVLDFTYDASGKRALVLSQDGTLHLLDGETLEKRETLALQSASPLATPTRELPGLAVGRRYAYVSEPDRARVHIIDTALAVTAGMIDLPSGGFPTQITVFKYAQ